MAVRAPTDSSPQRGVDPVVWARLEKLARASGRSAAELAEALLRDFLDENEGHLAAIDEGIAAADAGELVDFDEVEADVQKQLAALMTRGTSRTPAPAGR